MRSSLIRRTGRAAGLALAVVSAATSTVAFGADPQVEGSLIVADPLPGYSHDATSQLDGPIDVGTLMQLGGTQPADIPSVLRGFTGEARTWQSGDGLVAVAFVIDAGDGGSVVEFLNGALVAQRKRHVWTFDSELEGSAGFGEIQNDLSVATVIWRQGNYFVEVFAASQPESTASEQDVAKLLASSQARYLQASLGAAPSIDVSSLSENGADKGVAYRLGEIIGMALVVGLPVVLIVRSRRRRADRRAHEARFALPPPPFVAPAPLPPPTPGDGMVQ